MAQRATRLVLWGLVGLGALGGIVGALRAPAAAPAAVDGRAALTVPADVVGFAEMAVRSWLQAEDASDLRGVFAASVQLAPLAASRPVVGFAAAVEARPVAEGYWGVTVAAELRDPATPDASSRTWFVEVGVLRTATAMVAVTTPALVPAPEAATVALADPTLRTPLTDDPAIEAAEGFFAALLTGTGDVGRYLAPGLSIPAVSPPPFVAAHVQRAAATQIAPGRVRLRVEVAAATSSRAEWVLGYELELVERAGRWEAVALSGAPAIESRGASATQTTSPPAAPSSTAPVPEPGV